jgi:hypothetical protein
MLRRTLGVVLVNLIVFCVLAEVLALFVFYNDTGRLFYTYQKPYEPIAETQQGRLTGDGLHPYFGPTHRRGYPFDIPESLRENASSPVRVPTNNFGFAESVRHRHVRRIGRRVVLPGRRPSAGGRPQGERLLQGARDRPAVFES